MKTPPRTEVLRLAIVLLAAALPAASAAEPANLNRPDPREIPVPPIPTSLGSLPGVSDLPVRKEMPDVMIMNDGTRVTTQEQWKKRREEIRQTLEYYHVGRMPPPPGNVKGTEVSSQLLLNGKVRYRLIKLTFGPEEQLSLHIGIYAPADGAPVPVVIQPGGSPPGAPQLPRLAQGPGQGRGLDILLPADVLNAQVTAPDATGGAGKGGLVGGRGRGGRGSAPAAELSAAASAARGGRGGGFGGFGGPPDPERVAATNPAIAHGFAYVTFNTNDCAEDTTLRMPDGSFAFRTTRFFPAYPGYDWGVIGGWVWGTMRVVDYLQNDPAVDKTKIIITGTSRIGKAAMISGAFDERIALVAPGASSGLGTPAYRFSGEGRGGKEGLTVMVKKYANQFSPHLHEFWGQEDKLPYDAHWFPALTAPRPWIALEGTNDQNVVMNGVKQTFIAAQPAYALFNATDKIGVYWSDRPHGFGPNDWEGLLQFADKHLLGKHVDRVFNQFPLDLPATAPAQPVGN